MAQSLTRLNPPALPDAAALGYSQITTVEPGRLAFVSGQVAWRPDGKPAPDGLAEQAELVVANAKAALDAIGASPEDLVMVRVYMVDLTPGRIEELMPYLSALFDGAQPSLTGVGVAALAAPDLQLEMEMIVRLPS
ncbi:RidA family protein [Sinorhizobium mexicanum]|uniref:RidA family protein n=1 Tax=Sinorhizobium mexicanum TaxID=375549 RepID=A0A859QY12_9HYPH|nr:RidA family protein [Sinorhizobium mexicanum]MBP1887644.1 enamine deaminase RidA (YjgF/YER057c/UK114 family) [Sinorhizobium mexicanum]QLL62238.1 RidA family protein [Sinorhizobium mexicanum]